MLYDIDIVTCNMGWKLAIAIYTYFSKNAPGWAGALYIYVHLRITSQKEWRLFYL